MEVGKVANKVNSAIRSNKAVSFKGNPTTAIASATATKVKDAIPRYLPKWIIDIAKMQWLDGELGGIVVTAIGTGLVAPIFIAFNPFAKTDSDTKKYTAMRQPVSAALAIMFQAGMIGPFAMLLEKATNEGLLGDNVFINKVALQSEDYLRAKVKSDLAKTGELKGKTKEQADKIIKDKIKAIQAEQSKKLIESLKTEGKLVIGGEEVTKEQLQEIFELVKDGKQTTVAGQVIDEKKATELLSKVGESGTVKLGGVEVPKERLITIIKDTLEDYKKPFLKELAKAKGKDVPFKIERAQILVNNERDLRLKLSLIKSWNEDIDYRSIISGWAESAHNAGNYKLEKIYTEFLWLQDLDAVKSRAENTLEKITLFQNKISQARALKEADRVLTAANEMMPDGTTPRNFANIIADIKSQSTEADLIAAARTKLAEIIPDKTICEGIVSDMSTFPDLHSQRNFLDNLVERVAALRTIDSNDDILKLHQTMYYRLKSEFFERKIKLVDEVLPRITNGMTLEDLKGELKELAEKCKNLSPKDLYEEIINNYKKVRDGAFKLNKTIMSAVVGTAIFLPITCTSLNWVYPRFMDLFFPSLSRGKKANAQQTEGSKLNVKESGK